MPAYVVGGRRVPGPDRARREAWSFACSASANRDERRFPDGERFDVAPRADGDPDVLLRDPFLSRCRVGPTQGRVALEEVLKRFPEWTVDEANSKLIASSTTRGYESLPVLL